MMRVSVIGEGSVSSEGVSGEDVSSVGEGVRLG